jgi:hypothetical protein
MSSVRPVAVAFAAVALLLTVMATHGGGNRRASRSTDASPARHARPAQPRPAILTARRTARLPVPVQLPAGAPLAGGQAILAGGLSKTSASLAEVWTAGRGRARTAGSLPAALHDAAAATVAGHSYLFGGGEPSHDAILALRPGGVASQVGTIAAPASDVSAAAIGRTVYVVGGYTGIEPLATIQAWRPGQQRASVVAHLPKPLRYAAVAASAGRLVIAGGTSGVTPSRAVYSFDPTAARVSRIATLPRPLTHAAAAAVGSTVYVIGGRAGASGRQTDAIQALTLGRRRVWQAGRLPIALSDSAAVASGRGILLAGGRDAGGRTRDEVWRLTKR